MCPIDVADALCFFDDAAAPPAYRLTAVPPVCQAPVRHLQ